MSTNSDKRRVTLREITSKNLVSVLELKVSDEQKSVYPRSNAYSIAEAHYPRDDDPVWIRVIYADEAPVGFLMTSEDPEQGDYFLWRFMIDERFQGNGYGKRAMQLLIERIEGTTNPRSLITSHLRGDGDAGPFYRRLGFSYTGEILGDDDYLMKMDF